MPNVSPLFAINGGAPGVKASVAASSTVTATLDSIAGVNSVIWSIASTDDTAVPEDYTLVQSGIKGETVTLTALGDGTSAILDALVNNGIDETSNHNEALRATSKFWVPTLGGGIEVGCVNETFESDPTYGSTAELNAAIRAVGTSVGVTFAAVKAALGAANTAVDFNGQKLTGVEVPTTPTGVATKEFVEGLLGAATSTPTADTIAKWDGSRVMAAAAFKGEGTVAASGLLRGTNASTIVAAKDSSGNDLTVVVVSGADLLTIGDTARVANLALALKAAGGLSVVVGSVTPLFVDESGLLVADAAQSVTNPSGAIRAQSVDGAIKVRSPKGIVTTLSPKGNAVSTQRTLDIDAQSLQTTNDAPTVLLTVPIPAASIFELEWAVKAKRSDLGAWFRRVTRGHRQGGSFAIDQAVTPFADADTTGDALAVSIAVSGTDIVLTATGAAATTYDWSGTVRADIHAP